MMNLTFGEQVKIILSRKGMTIKELAEQVEKHTGKPMSRQNMTQRLGRDNFQEQDMRLIAQILGCKFQLSIMEMEAVETAVSGDISEEIPEVDVRDITIGELVDIADAVETPATPEMVETVEAVEEAAEPVMEKNVTENEREKEILRKGISGYFKKSNAEKKTEEPVLGEINPYTRKEYKNNSVRMHPKRIGYVQVYDAEQHKWTEMTEWAFLGYQERKKVLMGKDYEPPVYLD